VLDAKNVEGLATPQRARLGIGYLPQEPSVVSPAHGRQNLQLALQESGAPMAPAPERLEPA